MINIITIVKLEIFKNYALPKPSNGNRERNKNNNQSLVYIGRII